MSFLSHVFDSESVIFLYNLSPKCQKAAPHLSSIYLPIHFRSLESLKEKEVLVDKFFRKYLI